MSLRPVLLVLAAAPWAGLSAQTTHWVPARFATIQAAIDFAAAGDTVLVAPGVYLEHDLDFGGKAVSVRSSAGATQTVIDAQGMGRGVLFTSSETSASELAGFTITRGAAPDGFQGAVGQVGTDGEHGGGMLVLGASPTIRDCVMLDNDAGAGGRGGEGAHGVDGFSSGEDGENGGQGATGGTGGDGGGLYVDGGGSPVSAVKFIQVGDMLTLDVSSPGMTFVGSLTAMVVQAYPNGTSLPPDPGLPGLAISPFYPNLVIFIPGPGTPLGPPLLGPGGFSFNFLMPPGAAGLSTRWQAVPFSPAALNGIYAASVAHDIVGP